MIVVGVAAADNEAVAAARARAADNTQRPKSESRVATGSPVYLTHFHRKIQTNSNQIQTKIKRKTDTSRALRLIYWSQNRALSSRDFDDFQGRRKETPLGKSRPLNANENPMADRFERRGRNHSDRARCFASKAPRKPKRERKAARKEERKPRQLYRVSPGRSIDAPKAS